MPGIISKPLCSFCEKWIVGIYIYSLKKIIIGRKPRSLGYLDVLGT